MKKYFLFPATISFLFALSLNAQQFEISPVFDKDSLSGFNEIEARAIAIHDGFLGPEFKIKMYRMKREYINRKYNLISAKSSFRNGYFSDPLPSQAPVVPACVNLDFESSLAGLITNSNQIGGWTVVEGYNGEVNSSWTTDSLLLAAFPNGLHLPTSCNLIGCCPLQPHHSELIDCSSPGGYIDNDIGAQYPIFSVFGTGTVSGAAASNTQIPEGLFGTKVIRLNDNMTGDYSIAKLSRTFLVTSSNSLFRFAFISVFAPSHNCCDAGAFQIKLYNNGTSPNGNPIVLTCPNYSVSAPSSACTQTAPFTYYLPNSWTAYTPTASTAFGNIYSPWEVSSLDLSNYVGNYITIDVIVSDCNAGGHFSYVYFDADCSSADVFSQFDSTQVICAPVATLNAPPGFTSYQWTGPGAFTSTNAIVSVTTSGVYSLQINSPSLCMPISRTISVSVSNSGQSINSADSIICKGEGTILSAVGMYNCVWNTGDQTPSVYIMPDSTSSYHVTGTTLQGCTVSASYIQHVDECTGLKNEKLSSGVNLFPNPNGGEFILTLPKEIDKAELVITNALGLEIHRQNLRDSKNTIRLKNPKPGVYFYAVSNNKEIISKGKFEIE